MKVNASALRVGNIIEHDNRLLQVMGSEITKPGKVALMQLIPYGMSDQAIKMSFGSDHKKRSKKCLDDYERFCLLKATCILLWIQTLMSNLN